MTHRKFRLSPRKQTWADRFKPKILRGSPLRVSASIGIRYSNALLSRIERMERETRSELKKLFDSTAYAGDGDGAMDANTGAQARVVMNFLRGKYESIFADLAYPVTDAMMTQVDSNSAATLKTSLSEISEGVKFSTDILTDELREVLSATTAENVALIKRVPAKYLDQITGAVMRSIQNGNGLADLEEILDRQGVTVRNWAKNVAMDQTRKAYAGLNRGRMRALGIQKYEWVHSGGSNHPREYHRDVLNGQIFSLDDPPVIDERTKERGIPGQAPFCHCTMRPTLSFEDEDD